MCTKEKVTTEQKTLTVFRKSYVRKNDIARCSIASRVGVMLELNAHTYVG